MKKNKQALSLIIAISITLIMGLIAIYILDYIIPFSKNTKNIENSISAYYMADSAIEDTLFSMSGKALDWEKHKPMPSSSTGYSINMTASGKVLPPAGRGNSEFNKNYNIINIGNPIQIEVGNGKLSDFKLFLKLPDITGIGSLKTKDSNLEDIKYVNWQLTGNGKTLNSSGSQIIASQINNTGISFSNFDGLDLEDNNLNFSSFYSSNCGVGKKCILKLSVINELVSDSGEQIPYLEWKIENDNSIPLRYRIINTTGKYYGFQKSLEVKIPQDTLNEAFDFTVFQ